MEKLLFLLFLAVIPFGFFCNWLFDCLGLGPSRLTNDDPAIGHAPLQRSPIGMTEPSFAAKPQFSIRFLLLLTAAVAISIMAFRSNPWWRAAFAINFLTILYAAAGVTRITDPSRAFWTGTAVMLGFTVIIAAQLIWNLENILNALLEDDPINLPPWVGDDRDICVVWRAALINGLFAVFLHWLFAPRQKPSLGVWGMRAERQQQAVEAIEAAGGSVYFREEVWLQGTQATDGVLAHMAALPKLQLLWLRDSEITDAGMPHLRGLTALTSLSLDNTGVTDTGLVHLQGLTSLIELYLPDTQVTDAGLVHLHELTNLRYLSLKHTLVTNEGVARLQRALPRCEIWGPR
ncbi:MAG TPA: hypothetical protein VHC22_00230 [Pirellulales bacterium]|nr:hypothetical protein [Pirellulales bacterium]